MAVLEVANALQLLTRSSLHALLMALYSYFGLQILNPKEHYELLTSNSEGTSLFQSS